MWSEITGVLLSGCQLCMPYDVADKPYFFQGLFPAILNLASNAHISTNATCGEKGPEMFCKLVEHVPGRPLRNAQCRVCDRHSANPRGKLHVLWVLFVSWVCVFFGTLPLEYRVYWSKICFSLFTIWVQLPWSKGLTKCEHRVSPLSTAGSCDNFFVWGQISAFTSLWQEEIVLCVKQICFISDQKMQWDLFSRDV